MEKMTEESKTKVFAEDLAKIQSDEIRNFTLQVLSTAPEHFWIQPASSTGKYHPACTLGKSGLLVHTKRVSFLAENLIRAHGWKIPSNKADRIIAAAILHDIQKGGMGYGSYEDYENHPLLVDQRYMEVYRPEYAKGGVAAEIPEWEASIWMMIRHHMGPWSPAAVSRPVDQYTEKEIVLYHADYLATQKWLVTPVDDAIAKMDLAYLSYLSDAQVGVQTPDPKEKTDEARGADNQGEKGPGTGEGQGL